MLQIIFMWYLTLGVIVPDGDVDGRPLYYINSLNEEGTPIDHAYKGEIKQWILTGEFKYNEDFKD